MRAGAWLELERRVAPLERAGRWLDPSRIRAHALLLGICLWTVWIAGISTPGPIDRSGLLEGADFLQFQAFGSLAGASDRLYDPATFAQRAATLAPEADDLTYLPIYGPQLALLFAPFASLSYGTALAVWWLLSALVYAGCVWRIQRRLPALAGHGRSVALLAAANPAFFALIGYGQIAVLGLLCMTIAWEALDRDARFVAGLAIGSLAYKPQLGLAAAVVLVGAREWRIVTGAAVGAATQFALAAWLLGPDVIVEYVGVVASLTQLAPVLGHKLHQMHSLKSFFSALLPGGLALALWIPAVCVALASGLRVWRCDAPLALRFALLLLITALVNPHQYVYDLVLLVPAQLALASWILERPDEPAALRMRFLLHLAFLLPALGPLSRITHVQLSVPVLALLAFSVARAALPREPATSV